MKEAVKEDLNRLIKWNKEFVVLFPELKDKTQKLLEGGSLVVTDDEDFDCGNMYVDIDDIREKCLSKQKVKEAIDKVFAIHPIQARQCGKSVTQLLLTSKLLELKKELGLK